MKPFWQWKDEQIMRDSKPGIRLYRERDWYWKAYGDYCRRARKEQSNG